MKACLLQQNWWLIIGVLARSVATARLVSKLSYTHFLSVNIQYSETTIGTLTLVGTVTGTADFIRYSVMLTSLRNIISSIHYVIRSGVYSGKPNERIPALF